MMYRLISAQKARTPVSVACELLGVSRSGYYAWTTRAPSDRALSDAWLIEKIKDIHNSNRQVYGSRRVAAELRLGHGIVVSRKRIQRLMRAAGISGLVARKRGRTTIRVPGVRVADDLVRRQFRPAAPDVLWVADITYLRTWEGWLYLAAVQDAYSRRIVGWSMADHMRAELVVDALQMGVHRRRPAPGLVHHSDQGSRPDSTGRCNTLILDAAHQTWATHRDFGVPQDIGVPETLGTSVVDDRRGDAGLIRIDPNSPYADVRPWIYVSGRGITRRSTQYRIRRVGFTPRPPTSPPGRYVCMSGMRTGGHCGEVTRTAAGSQRFGIINICRPGHPDAAAKGDSGSPVVKAGQARGLYIGSSASSCQAVFQSARLAEDLLQVSISH